MYAYSLTFFVGSGLSISEKLVNHKHLLPYSLTFFVRWGLSISEKLVNKKYPLAVFPKTQQHYALIPTQNLRNLGIYWPVSYHLIDMGVASYRPVVSFKYA